MQDEILIISHDTGGDIALNQDLMEELIHGGRGNKIIEMAKEGTPLLKMGSGSPRILLCAGIHGNELPPQLAFFHF